MKQNVSFCMFLDSFSEQYKNNFTYEGKKALFEYLEDLEDSMGEEFELDPVAFCCEYTEYKDLKELQENYSDIETMEELENNTMVIYIKETEGFIIQDF